MNHPPKPSSTWARPLALFVTASVAGWIGANLSGCVLRNPDHCFNLAADTNAWCADAHPEQPFCSPCEAENNGCVAEEPSEDECPEYSAQPPDTGTDTGTGTGETGGTGTDTGESGGTTTGETGR